MIEVIVGGALLWLLSRSSADAAPREGVLANQATFQLNTNFVFDPNAKTLRVPDKHEEIAIRYLVSYLCFISKKNKDGKRLIDHELIQKILSNTNVVASEITAFADAFVAGGEIGGKVLPIFGHVIGATLGTVVEVMAFLWRTQNRADQLLALRKGWEDFILLMGPPPVGLLHYFSAMGDAKYDAREADTYEGWSLGLHKQFLLAIASMKAHRWPVLELQPITKSQVQSAVNAGQTNYVGGSPLWGTWKPAKNTRGPWAWMWAFHSSFLFSSDSVLDVQHQRIMRSKPPGDWFTWTKADQKKWNVKNRALQEFSVGSDPFQFHSGVSTNRRDWEAKVKLFMQSDHPQNWMINGG